MRRREAAERMLNMNDKILCVCYSRTGSTLQAMSEIAEALDCELVELKDKVNRSGALGYIRCGLDAMRKRTRPTTKLVTERELSDYELVILGTPIWAGRCSSVIRGFLKRHGGEMQNVGYVITHKSEVLYKEVYRQMDLYVDKAHVADVSLRPGDTGYHFWRDQFIKKCSDFISGSNA